LAMKPKLIDSKYNTLSIILSVTISCGLLKYGLHVMRWEPFSILIHPYFTTILTGTIFLLGFILAGVLADYKKSEAIPGKMVTSLYTIWQETEILDKTLVAPVAKCMQRKICNFIEVFKSEFLLQRKEEKTFEMLYSFSNDFASMDQSGVAPNFMARLRNEQTNLVDHLTTIKYIRDTSFMDSGYVIIKVILSVYSLMLILNKFEDFDSGVFFMCFCIFILWSIFAMILDMDDPFDYVDEKVKPDEVDFKVLYDFCEKIKVKMEGAR
jgi:hypothetical protein